MDISTLILLAGLLFGAIIGDAVVFGRTVRVDFTLPKSVEAQGMTQDAAENVFISEMARLADIPFILPFPTVAQSSRDSLLSVVAKPLKIDPVVEILQDKFGADRVNIKMLMFAGDGDGMLDLHALVTVTNGTAARFAVKGPAKNPHALIESMARAIATGILPYRVALSMYNESLHGAPTKLAEAETLAKETLSEGFDKSRAQQRALMFNVMALIAMQRNDPAGAEERLAAGLQVPLVPPTARSILAVNRSFLALGRKDIKAARAYYDQAMELKVAPYLDYYDHHLVMLDGLILWGEGHLDAAEERFRHVEQFVLGDTALTYRARILEFRGKTDEAKALAGRAAFLKTIRNQHPDLIGSVFWVDPIKGGLQRR